jgi:ferric-dicitrate binding protein FerR (iron transport regulator)
MLPDQFQLLLEKFSRGACTPEEEQLVIEWYQNIGAKEVPLVQEEQVEIVEQKIWAAINPEPVSSGRNWVRRVAIFGLPILAAIALYSNRQAVSSLVAPPESASIPAQVNETIYRNQGSTPMQVSLADGSSVVLQSTSELTLDSEFGKTTREVHLNGEAFFSVFRDESKPFVVYTEEVVTRVLGTSFNIRAYEDDGEITVAVKTGKVSVYANKHKTSRQVMHTPEVILSPNQQMVYHRESEVISKQLVAEPEIILPNSDLFRMQFENVEVANIFDVLQRNYGVEIRFDRHILGNCRLTTTMSDEGLYERIAVICKAIGAAYSIDEDAVITIKSDGC